MNKMESKIAVTFSTLFVIAVAINSIFSVLFTDEDFLSFHLLAYSMISASMYLVFLFIETRRHQFLAYFGILVTSLTSFFITLSLDSDKSKKIEWYDTIYFIIMLIYFFITKVIASKHATKLMAEYAEENNSNICNTLSVEKKHFSDEYYEDIEEEAEEYDDPYI